MQQQVGPRSLLRAHSGALAGEQVNSLHPTWLLQAEPCLVAQAAKLGGLNWGCQVPSASLESCRARHAVKQGLR